MNPTFSIIHASARPNGWLASHNAWVQNAEAPAAVEYILACECRRGFPESYSYPGVRIIRTEESRTCIESWNTAARQARNQVLLINSDDMFPCAGWDRKLLEAIPDLDGEYVVETTSNTPADEARIMVFQILTRRRLERIGYVFWPEYESVSADIEFSEHARRDGVVIDARHITIEHRHYAFGTADFDSMYAHQNRPEAYQIGDAVLRRRRESGFSVEMQ